jgi:hypothetical protein
MLRFDPPHLKVHTNGIEDRQVSRTLLWIAIGFRAHVHPLQWDPVLLGDPFDHIHGAGRHAGEKQFASANLIAANLIGNEMMRATITDGTVMRSRALTVYFIGQSERTHRFSLRPS